MTPNSQAEKKTVDLLDEVLPELADRARELYHGGNERDSNRITKAITELRKVRDSLE